MRILEKDGMEGLTTNAVAALAGVSIGTLYQYFPDKAALLSALADREFALMSARVVAAMQDPGIASPYDRVAALVRAVAASYDRRREAHRLVMAHSLSRGSNRLAPLLGRIRAHLSTERTSGAFTAALSGADAFVLSHAFAGVLRGMTSDSRDAPHQAELEASLARLVVSFLT